MLKPTSIVLAAVALLTLAIAPPGPGVPAVSAQVAGVCGANPSPPDSADPSITVDWPYADAVLGSPLRVSGMARVFEATVSLALRDAGGGTIAEGFVTASAGAPSLAPFSGTLAFQVSSPTPACLWVFEESARDGSPRNVVQVPLTLLPPGARFIESRLHLGDPRPCIPAAGTQDCDPTRRALWSGSAEAWAQRGVTQPDAVFNETVVFRVQQGDPAAISNIAKILGQPYLKITRIQFAGEGELLEITNLGGGAQSITGWTVRFRETGAFADLPSQTLAPGASCYLLAGLAEPDSDTSCRVYADTRAGSGGLWLDDRGTVILSADPVALVADETRYSADPLFQPPLPNLQGTRVVTSGQNDGGSEQPGGVEFRLSTPEQQYEPGAEVPFTMTLRNISAQPQTLTFPRGQSFEVVVRDATGQVVWRWSRGMAFTEAVRTETLAPGEERTFSATWNQTVDGAGQAPSGAYQAVATLMTRTLPASNTVDFRLLSSPADPALEAAIRAYIDRQIMANVWRDQPYAGPCDRAQLPADGGKYCSFVQPDANTGRVEVGLGLTFSEVFVIVMFEQRDGAWVVVNERVAPTPR